jgi:carbonic anhydrase
MRLFETIVSANQRGPDGTRRVEIPLPDIQEALPLAALTCIDARLNHLLPEVLGVPEEHFIWLRNAGNIITGPLSSTVRSLALACAIKGAKEIAIIGHTDCLVGKTTMLKLTDALAGLGIGRARLPENLNEYFGLFASERQNVMRAADLVRQSPLIGAKVPVHGLVLDIQTCKLEWLVNGYEAVGTVASTFSAVVKGAVAEGLQTLTAKLPDLDLGEMKFPEFKIGETTINPNTWLAQVKTAPASKPDPTPAQATQPATSDVEQQFDKTRKYRVIGSDQKVYGPIGGLKILEWIAEGRINWQTPSQVEGSSEWRPLSLWSEVLRRLPPELPPKLTGMLKRWAKDGRKER